MGSKFFNFAINNEIMPELIIRYNNQETLQALINLAKSLDFEIAKPAVNKKGKSIINRVTLIEGDDSVDVSTMSEIYTGKNLDASTLRTQAWQRG